MTSEHAKKGCLKIIFLREWKGAGTFLIEVTTSRKLERVHTWKSRCKLFFKSKGFCKVYKTKNPIE